jgi:hypothetical protein
MGTAARRCEHAVHVERNRSEASLHQRIAGALSRAAHVNEDSRALIAECHRVSVALRETVDEVHRQRRDRRQARPDR